MKPLNFARHRFPPDVIRYVVWLYFRFTLSFRDIEDLLAERGLDISYETVRCWTLKFGPMIAANLRRRRPRPTPRWHLDEMVVRIRGMRMYMWCAVDDEGEVLDVLVQKRRNKAAALRLLKKLMKRQGAPPERMVTDKLYYVWGGGAGLWDARRSTFLAACAKTIALRIRICRCDDESGKCNASRVRAQHRNSFQPTESSTTPSITQRHLVSRRTLRLFRAEAHQAWTAACEAA